MRADTDGSVGARTALPGEHRAAGELAELRTRCWRQTHEIHTLRETIEVLRAGANSLAIDNAILRLESERMPLTRAGGCSHSPPRARPAVEHDARRQAAVPGRDRMSEERKIVGPARGEPLRAGRVGVRLRFPLSNTPSGASVE